MFAECEVQYLFSFLFFSFLRCVFSHPQNFHSRKRAFSTTKNHHHDASTLLPQRSSNSYHHSNRTSRNRNSHTHPSPSILGRELSHLRLFPKHHLRHYPPLHRSNNHPNRLQPQRHHAPRLPRTRTMYV